MVRVISSVSMSSSTRNKAILLVAAIFGILSAGLVFAFLNSQNTTTTADTVLGDALREGQGSQVVVVATENIAPGETIEPSMLTTATFPPNVLVDGVVLDASAIVGKVATAPIFAGEQVLVAKVTTYEGQNTLAYKVPAGLRALSVMIPHEAWANAGLARPGDHVDVFGVTVFIELDPLTGQERPNVIAGIIAEDVEVLAVSQTAIEIISNTDARGDLESGTGSGEELGGTGGTGEGTEVGEGSHTAGEHTGTTAASARVGNPDDKVETFEEALSVTIAVTPEQAAKILIIDAMQDDVAQFRVVTRQVGDTERVTGTSIWSLDDVFEPTN